LKHERNFARRGNVSQNHRDQRSTASAAATTGSSLEKPAVFFYAHPANASNRPLGKQALRCASLVVRVLILDAFITANVAVVFSANSIVAVRYLPEKSVL